MSDSDEVKDRPQLMVEQLKQEKKPLVQPLTACLLTSKMNVIPVDRRRHGRHKR